MVEPDDIYKIVRSTHAEDVPDRLIRAANMSGGSDNITVVAVTQ